MSTSEKVKGHLPIPSTWVFLGLAFALSWPILIYGFGWFSSEEDILKRYLLSCTGMLAIAFSALITRIFIERRGFQEAGWNLGHYKWYVGILVFNLFLWLAPPLAALIFGNLDFNEHPTQDQLVVVFLSLGGFSLLAGF